MSDRVAMDKKDFQEKIIETEQAIAHDRNCREHDAKEYHKKHTYLMQYRDGNKQVIAVYIFIGEQQPMLLNLQLTKFKLCIHDM